MGKSSNKWYGYKRRVICSSNVYSNWFTSNIFRYISFILFRYGFTISKRWYRSYFCASS